MDANPEQTKKPGEQKTFEQVEHHAGDDAPQRPGARPFSRPIAFLTVTLPIVMLVTLMSLWWIVGGKREKDWRAAFKDFSDRSVSLGDSFSELVRLAGALGAIFLVASALLTVRADRWTLEWFAALFAFLGAVLSLPALRVWVSRAKMPLFLLVVAAVFLAWRVDVPSGAPTLGHVLHFAYEAWWPLLESLLVAFLLGHLLFLGKKAATDLAVSRNWNTPTWLDAVVASVVGENAQQVAGVTLLFCALVLQIRVA